MANTFYRESIGGGDSGIWDQYELPQNRNVEGNVSCKLYDDSGDLKITTGRIGFHDGTNRGTMVIDTVTTISIAGVSNGNWAKIEMALSSGAPVFTAADISGATDSTTVPAGFTGAWVGDKQGYYIEATKRCVGLAWKESGGTLSGIINVFPNFEGYAGNSENKGFLKIKDHDLSNLISVSGLVGIGQIAPESSLHVSGVCSTNPQKKGVHIGLESDFAAIELKGATASEGGLIDFGYANDGDFQGRIVYQNSLDILVFYSNSLESLKLESDGGIFFNRLLGSTGGSDARYDTSTKELFYDTSALKYKENIRDAEDIDTAFLHQIPIKKYDRKDGRKTDEIGIIAEDLEAVRPDLICKNENDEVESYSKSDLVPYLILEIQKLKKEIDALKAK